MKISLPGGIRFGREILGDLAQAESREWWLSNGLGAYAAGNLAGTLTRRYHGLLIAPVRPPLGRALVFAKADAELLAGDRSWPLFANRWGGDVVAPAGNVYLESFRLEGRMPVWLYAFGDIRLEHRIWMEPGANTTYLAYRWLPDSFSEETPLKLRIVLLVNARDHHGNARPGGFTPLIEGRERELKVCQPDSFTLYLSACGGLIETDSTWYENFDLAAERERGLPAQDAHLCAGKAELRLTPGHWVGIVASLHDDASPYLEEAMRRFQTHDHRLLLHSRLNVPELRRAPAWIEQLVLAADNFLLKRPMPDFPEGLSVIAGFPWFGEWGRDAMIALPGLTLATGRIEQARRILKAYARFIDAGMLPNTLDETGGPLGYNSADAALWFIEAWRSYLECVDDKTALKRIFPLLQQIIGHYRQGTRHGIAADPEDGLLAAGESGLQVTWMDAKVGDWVVTPRMGKPVEINALWYNALKTMALFAKGLGLEDADYAAMAEKVHLGFKRFINPANGGLFDVLDGPEGHDDAIRPNQILAVSLHYSPLDAEVQAGVVGLCRRELLTTYGLRTLSSSHPNFRPHYGGDLWERDGAYHQGTVWTWLLGHYALAEYRVHGDARRAQALLEPLSDHLRDAGLGTLSEIFDAEPPHQAHGCPAQAWSVACTLEAWWRLERAARKKSLQEPSTRAGNQQP